MTLTVLHFHAGNVFGGVERMLVDLAGAGAGLQHHFALSWPGHTADQLSTVGTIHQVPPVRFSRPWQVRRARRRARDIITAVRPDRILTHSDWSHAIYGPVAGRAGIPHVRFHHSPPGHPLLRWAARRHTPALEIANSRWTAVQCGVQAVIHPPVTPPRVTTDRATVRRAAGTPQDAVVGVMVARLEAWKGHRVLLEAFDAMREGPGELWIVGGAQSPAEARYLASLPRPTGVRWLGQRSDVGSVLAAADFCCHPSVQPEPFGIALVEALYAGLPVIATNVGGPAEIVTPACGVLVPPGDAVALATTLEALASDGPRRAALGAAGPARAAALCDPRRQAALVAALLQQAGTTTFPAG